MLYHYTDFIAFDGIVGNTELRLNNVLNMNDDQEMRFYMDGIGKAVMKRLAENRLYDKAHAMEIFFQNELEEEFNYSAYAACFSQYRDDAAQWERYGKWGQGVCISFDEDMLTRITSVTEGAVSMRKVHYSRNFDNLEIVGQFYQLVKDSDSLTSRIEELEKLLVEAWITSAAFKHPSFANENEVRMVVTPSVSASFPITPKYHISLGRIKKYYPMNLGDMCEKAGITMEDLVKEVTIGPTSTQSVPILKDYLRDKGYKHLAEKVRISECPLRKPTT